ncbi:MAG: ABC transporter permease [Sphaerochaetaceae bacterium]|nr:ABC transporter permease [Sphaerochaetaceae bacterium]
MKKFSILGKIAFFILALNIIFALTSLFIPESFYSTPMGDSFIHPGLLHPLGTDDLGMDIFFQIIHGSLISLTIGISTAILSGFGGSILGILAAYKGGIYDSIIMGICDVITALPHLPFIIVLSVFIGPGIKTIIIVISILSWVGPAKMIRAKVLMLKNEKYIIASKSYGANFFYLTFVHFLPQVFPMIAVSMFKTASHSIISEASLSFLGLGDPTSKSWGILLNNAINFEGIYFTDYWKWWITSPLIMLILLILALSFFARDLEKILNQKL